MRMFRLVGCLCVVTGLLSAAVDAQQTTGSIAGTVKDSSGAVLPNATVRIRNTGTNVSTTVQTDPSGTYVAPFLPPGPYDVTAEMPGFKTFVRGGLELHVNDRLAVDITMEAGAVTERVTVMGKSPVIQTQSSEVSTLINATQVSQMPLNGRNIIQLVAMQPGVSSTLPSTMTVGLGTNTNVFVNGNRASQNNWMIDGADNNDVGSNLAMINYINVDTVNEVKILRSNYSAEFGRSGGAQVNVVTKSGTNEYHGSAFEFLRDDRFDAHNAFSFLDFDKDGKADPPPLDYHNFGWTIGGPIQKDKLFVFWGEEFRRIRTVLGGGVVNTRVPTDAQREGNFAGLPTITDPLNGLPFENNRIPPDRIDPIARALLGRFPRVNADPAALGGNLNFSAAAPSIRDFREELVRVDYAFSPRHTFYTRLIFDTIPSTEPFGLFTQAAFPGISDTKTDNPGRSVVSTWNWTVTPSMTSELSYNYSRGALLSQITGPSQRDISIPKTFSGVPGDDILPGIAFSSGTYGGFNFFGPYDNTYGSHRLKETLSHTAGAHALKGGFLYSFEFKNENAAGGTNGSFVFPGTSSSSYTSTGDALADFLLGRASSYSESRIDITSHLRFQMYEAFVQDDWRILPNLTLNLGARWSYILQPYDADNVLTNFDPSLFDPARAYQIGNDNNRIPGTGDPLNGIVIAGENSPYGRRVVASHANTIGSRAGFAWDPRGDGRTAIRGGYGMYFDRTLVGIVLQNAFTNPPFAFTAVVNAAGPAVPTLQNPRAGAARDPEVPVPNLIAMSPDFKIPTTHQYSIGIQRELPFGFNADIAYVGTQGRNLLQMLALNQTPAGTVAPSNRARPYRGWGNITYRSTQASSEYNSLQVSLFRRLQAGFQIGVNYTLSKVVTDTSSDRAAADVQQDINNLQAERALATYDRTHIFGTHYVWEIPFFRNADALLYNVLGGWQLTGSTRIMSGLPLTITATANTANSFGGGPQRPDLVGDPEGPRTVAQWFNTEAFRLPAPNTFGNAPRSVVRGPGTFVTDLGIFKNFRAADRIRMQFRAELFNAFNHTNFVGVGTTLGLSTFGRLTSSAEARVIQFGLKLTF